MIRWGIAIAWTFAVLGCSPETEQTSADAIDTFGPADTSDASGQDDSVGISPEDTNNTSDTAEPSDVNDPSDSNDGSDTFGGSDTRDPSDTDTLVADVATDTLAADVATDTLVADVTDTLVADVATDTLVTDATDTSFTDTLTLDTTPNDVATDTSPVFIGDATITTSPNPVPEFRIAEGDDCDSLGAPKLYTEQYRAMPFSNKTSGDSGQWSYAGCNGASTPGSGTLDRVLAITPSASGSLRITNHGGSTLITTACGDVTQCLAARAVFSSQPLGAQVQAGTTYYVHLDNAEDDAYDGGILQPPGLVHVEMPRHRCGAPPTDPVSLPCRHWDCRDDPRCLESTMPGACAPGDGVDDDNDGAVDCLDSDCINEPACMAVTPQGDTCADPIEIGGLPSTVTLDTCALDDHGTVFVSSFDGCTSNLVPTGVDGVVRFVAPEVGSYVVSVATALSGTLHVAAADTGCVLSTAAAVNYWASCKASLSLPTTDVAHFAAGAVGEVFDIVVDTAPGACGPVALTIDHTPPTAPGAGCDNAINIASVPTQFEVDMCAAVNSHDDSQATCSDGGADLTIKFEAPVTGEYVIQSDHGRIYGSPINEPCPIDGVPSSFGTTGCFQEGQFFANAGDTRYFSLQLRYDICSPVEVSAHRVTAQELDCHDGIDNDDDGKTDCDDSSCIGPGCNESYTTLNCRDGVDNDSDGKTDCDDLDCAFKFLCKEGWQATDCTDGIDNSGNGHIDCADPGCDDAPNCNEALVPGQCSDGIDNDGNSVTDCFDAQCVTGDPVACPVMRGSDCDDLPVIIDPLGAPPTVNLCDAPDNTLYFEFIAPGPGSFKAVGDEFDFVKTCPSDHLVDGDIAVDATYAGQSFILRARSYWCYPYTGVVEMVTPEICDDQISNDADYFVDCIDPDCSAAAHCSEGADVPGACSDGVDNNGDGVVDCDDPVCRIADPVACPHVAGESCLMPLSLDSATASVDFDTCDFIDRRRSRGLGGCHDGPIASSAPDGVVAFTAPAAGSYLLTLDSDWESILNVVSGVTGCPGPGTLDTCVASADHIGGGEQVHLDGVSAGETYFVVVDGWNTGCGPATLSVEPVTP